nr:MAG TPA: hypothetical protein [Caudoviricetes sp.]
MGRGLTNTPGGDATIPARRRAGSQATQSKPSLPAGDGRG